jgi:hypothetical protein
MNFSKTLFRCSSLGHLMVEPRSKKEGLSETCKNHLTDVFVSNKYNRQTDIQNKFIQKGLMVEEDSITLYSRINKSFFKKNEEPLSNEFIKGTPDLYIGENINSSSVIIDIKSSWDIFTFYRNHNKEINNLYYWQLQGYMALTGAEEARLAYCLVDTPDVLVNDEKRKLLWQMGVASEDNPDFIEACIELDKLRKYGDIPIEERLIEFKIERNDDDITRLYERIASCRTFLNDLENKLNPKVLIATGDTINNTNLVIVE